MRQRMPGLIDPKLSRVITHMPLAYAGATLPRSGTFTTFGGALVFFVTVGGYFSSGSGGVTFDVKLDTVTIGTLGFGFNNTSVHHALPPMMISKNDLAAGSHTVELSSATIATDTNDFSQVMVLEFL